MTFAVSKAKDIWSICFAVSIIRIKVEQLTSILCAVSKQARSVDVVKIEDVIVVLTVGRIDFEFSIVSIGLVWKEEAYVVIEENNVGECAVNFATNWVFWCNVEKTLLVLFLNDSRVDDIVVWITRVAVVDCFEKAVVVVEGGSDEWTTGDEVVDELVAEVVDDIGLVENVDGGDTEVFLGVCEFFNGWEDKVEVVNIEEK